ncbi:MAG: hypothetical protein GC154_02635 [bacterium]|nr:hypothetical protein [bacterium]
MKTVYVSMITAVFVLNFCGCETIPPIEAHPSLVIKIDGEQGQQFDGVVKTMGGDQNLKGITPSQYSFTARSIKAHFTKISGEGTMSFKVRDGENELDFGSLTKPGTDLNFQYEKY